MKRCSTRHSLLVGCIDSPELLRRCARRAPAVCDVLEVRLDLTGLCGGEWLNLCAAIERQGRPVILTIRSSREGGQWRGREAERLALYLQAARVVSMLDVELAATRTVAALVPVAKANGVRLIGSFHHFEKTPPLSRLLAVAARGRQRPVDVIKIATRVNRAAELANLLALPALVKGPLSVMGMGPLGGLSRVAAAAAGSHLVYGSLAKATAPGQPSCRELASELVRWGLRPASPALPRRGRETH